MATCEGEEGAEVVPASGAVGTEVVTSMDIEVDDMV